MLISKYYTKEPIIIDHDCDKRIKYFIDGRKRKEKECMGFCACCDHPGYLTKKMMNHHDCDGKCCKWFLIDVDFEKNENKISKQNSLLQEKQNMIEKGLLLEQCRQASSDYEGIKIMSAEKEATRVLIKYVAIASFDEERLKREIIEKLLIDNIEFEMLNYDFETSVKIIYS